jgi:tRNA threonylcarbamoyladenosine biosynthesis protein TsaB
MTILTIRSDKPEAEIGIFNDGQQLAYVTWQAHRALAETLHGKIRDLLAEQGLGMQEVEGIVVYKGPGSFTGLRIGLSVANALAYGLNIPIVGATDTSWAQDGVKRLLGGENEKIILPEYGADVHITLPKH